ncbi:MAG: hypothetical protein PHX21_08535 [bacterium]|nr:hypothetical protein [bacterium]
MATDNRHACLPAGMHTESRKLDIKIERRKKQWIPAFAGMTKQGIEKNVG